MNYFLFIVVFFKRCLTVIDFVDFTHSCANRLIPGGNNRPYALNKSEIFTNRFLSLTSRTSRHKRVKFHLSGFVLTQAFSKALVVHIFLLSQLNTKIQKCRPNAMSQNCPLKHFNVNIITLCWVFYKLLLRVGPGQLVLCDVTFTCQESGCLWMNFNQFNNCELKESRNT